MRFNSIPNEESLGLDETITTPASSPSNMRMEAAYTSVLSGDVNPVSAYQKTYAELEGGHSDYMDSVLDKGDTEFHEWRKSPQSVRVMLEVSSPEEAISFYQQGMTAAKERFSLISQASSKYLGEPVSPFQTKEEAETRFNAIDSFDHLESTQGSINQMRNQESAKMNEAEFGETEAEIGMSFIPGVDIAFNTQVFYSMRNKGLIEEEPSTFGEFFAMAGASGSQKMLMKEFFEAQTLEGQEAFVSYLIQSLDNMALGSSNNFNRNAIIEDITGGDYSQFDRVLDDVFSALDLAGFAGAAIKGVGKVGKAFSKAGKLDIVKGAQVEASADVGEAVRGHLTALRQKARSQAITGEKAAVSPAQTAANTNPTIANNIYEVIKQGDDEAAEALAGVSRHNYLVSEKAPQVAGSIVLKKVDDAPEEALFNKLDNSVASSYYRIVNQGNRAKLSYTSSSIDVGVKGKPVLRHVYNKSSNRPFNNAYDAIKDVAVMMAPLGVKAEDLKIMKWENGVGSILTKEEASAAIKSKEKGSFSVSLDLQIGKDFGDVTSYATETPVDLVDRALSIGKMPVNGLVNTIEYAAKDVTGGGLTRSIFAGNTYVDKNIYQPLAAGQYRARASYSRMRELGEPYAASLEKLTKAQKKTFENNLFSMPLNTDIKEIVELAEGDSKLIDAWKAHKDYWQATNYIRNEAVVSSLKSEGYVYAENFRGFKGWVVKTEPTQLPSSGVIRYVDESGVVRETGRMNIQRVNTFLSAYREGLATGLSHNQALIKNRADLEDWEFELAKSLLPHGENGGLYKIYGSQGIEYINLNGFNLKEVDGPAIDLNTAKSYGEFTHWYEIKNDRDKSVTYIPKTGDAGFMNLGDDIKTIIPKNNQEAIRMAKEYYAKRDAVNNAPTVGIDGKVVYEKSILGSVSQTATLDDMMDNLGRSTKEMADMGVLDKYVAEAKTNWMKKYAHLVGKDAVDGIRYFPNSSKMIKGEDPVEAGQALREWEYIRMNEFGESRWANVAWRRLVDAGAKQFPQTKTTLMVKDAIGESTPVDSLKGMAYISQIVLNPIAQFIMNNMQAVMTAGGALAYPTRIPRIINDFYLIKAASYFGVNSDMFKHMAKISMSNLEDAKKMVKDFEDTGLAAAMDLQHDFEIGRRFASRSPSSAARKASTEVKEGNYAKAAVVGALGAGKAAKRVIEKVGIERPDHTNKVMAYLLQREHVKQKYGVKHLNAKQRDEALALASETTLDMTAAGQTTISQSTMGLFIQYLNTALKASVNMIPGIGNLPKRQKVSMIATSVVAFGLPEWIEKQFPDMPDSFKQGLFWGMVEDVSGVKINANRFDMLDPVSVFESYFEAISGPLTYAAEQSPVSSLVGKMLTMAGVDLGFTLVDEETPITAVERINGYAAIMSGGYSNYLKYKAMIAKASSEQEASEAYAMLIGGRGATMEAGAEDAFWEAYNTAKSNEDKAGEYVKDIKFLQSLKGDYDMEAYQLQATTITTLLKDESASTQLRVIKMLQREKVKTPVEIRHLEMGYKLATQGDVEGLEELRGMGGQFTEDQSHALEEVAGQYQPK